MNEDEAAPTNPFAVPAPKYAQVRPDYPPSIIDHVLRVCGQGIAARPTKAADIGAGTGKMAVLLAERGLVIDAVEPSEAMRDQMAQALPDVIANGQVRAHDATAERTGLADSSVELVVAAQSWHWVDAALAAQEAARILVPGGTLAVVWNQMDVSIPWVKRLTRIMRSGDVHRPDNPPSFGPRFTTPALVVESWEDTMTTEQILELGTTRSSYLRQDEAGRARMQANLRWYLHEHLGYAPGSSVVLPYSTLAWTGVRWD
ncbi:class I SAM-dependent methyltransferase [Schaalia vaccimaxillae]|uniref:class I SAM-dependent methyltransferase n=1 Tax=Schaalia vaccimaxillae TaxID=183916 RepID=UPI0003B7051C|nr:class I SAM-dependent methyltransferase [Schaalia vaccimaxillae]